MTDRLWLICALMLAVRPAAAAADWGIADDPAAWEAAKGPAPAASTEHATEGGESLRVESGNYITTWKLPRDWSGHDSLDFDAFNDTGEVVAVHLLIGDEAWKEVKGGTYWNRHNGEFNLLPGANRVSIPVEGLYRGEAGSRNNDIKRNIDPDSIVRIDLGFTGKPGAIYLDNFRLVKGDKPEGVWAFDFGPASQTLWPGFKPVSWETEYAKERGYGLRRKQPAANWSRDDTFPTRLFQDATLLEGAEFLVDLPGGEYRVSVVFNDCGYWGGEFARHTARWITAEGREAWREDRKELAGDRHALFRFEDVEPVPGSDVAELYYDPLFEVREFDARVTDGQLNLGFKSDAWWSTRVAAIAIHPARDRKAREWVAGVWEANRKEFIARAAEVPLAQPEGLEALPASEREKGYLLFLPDHDEEVHFNLVPRSGQIARGVRRAAARGEVASFTFAVRPLRDLGEVEIEPGELKGEAGTIPASAMRPRVVRNLAKRSFNNIRWRLRPWVLDEVRNVSLSSGLTRQFWVTIAVPEDAAAGKYAGEIAIGAGRGLKETIRIEMEVLPFTLDEPGIPIAFYGMRKEWMGFMREYGMTTVSGGPNVKFERFDEKGRPVLDFAGVDDYMRAAREAGYRDLVLSYGGPANLQGAGYEGLPELFAEWGKPAGLDAKAAGRRIFDAIKRHSEEENWLPFLFPMADEPRVRETTARIIESVKFLKDVAPWMKLGGSYSVDNRKGDDPLLHEALFRELDISLLNVHDPAIMELAEKLGKDIYIYNQGRDRYTFGAYLFSEKAKGVKGFCQWHMFATHGYQYFDLDGREPDDGIIAVRSDGIHPTLDLERVRIGVNDLRYLRTLERLDPDNAVLKRLNDRLGLSERGRPEWLDLDDLRAEVAREIVRLLAR